MNKILELMNSLALKNYIYNQERLKIQINSNGDCIVTSWNDHSLNNEVCRIEDLGYFQLIGILEELEQRISHA